LQKGHTWKLIRAEWQSKKGRFIGLFWPNDIPHQGKKGSLGILLKKREACVRFPCSCKDTAFKAHLQMANERF
jgi:hypothetical protein